MKRAFFITSLIFVLSVPLSWAQIPETMSYQGKLTNNAGEPVEDSDYELIFSIYDVDAGGTALWTEFHGPVATANGIFNVILGNNTPLDIAFDKQYWLGITVTPGSELTPRIPLTSTAYSLNARTVSDGAITSPKIMEGQVVKSINTLRDDITLGEGANVTITPSDNTLIIAATGGVTGWELSGNAGTDAGINFLGTTDDMPLNLKVNNFRVLKLESAGSDCNIIGGFGGNWVAADIGGATISGGGSESFVNSITNNFGAIGGGRSNTVSGEFGTVAGGFGNTAQGDYSFAAGRRAKANHTGAFVWGDSTDADVTSTLQDQFIVRANGGVRLFTGAGGLFLSANTICSNIIGGFTNNTFSIGVVGATIGGGGVNGSENIVTDNYSSVGGGKGNQAGNNAGDTIDAAHATVSGGRDNAASGAYAVVGGGWDNAAGAFCATIGGGGPYTPGDPSTSNRVTDDFGTVSGGSNNQAGDASGASSDATYATVGGGVGNIASEAGATIGGGIDNKAGDQCAVGGGYGNEASGIAATIGGGWANEAASHSSTVGGGYGNYAVGFCATVSGGGASNPSSFAYSNRVTDDYGTVGGGGDNQAGNNVWWPTPPNPSESRTDASYATVAGGRSNKAAGSYASIGGGDSNAAPGYGATVPGGESNTASGDYAFAAGRQASASHTGTFVWGDSTIVTSLDSTGVDQFIACASGGIWFYSKSDLSKGVRLDPDATSWTGFSSSDKALKHNIRQMDGRDILSKLAQIPISRWSYKSQVPGIEHIGPMSQDFYAAFGLGADDKHIDAIDADGVSLAAIQGLYELLQERDAQIKTVIQEKDAKIADLEMRLAALEALVSQNIQK